jgi:3-phenylpropionate/trans-cinnamate dioxygenase ferredoxin component
MPSYHDALPAGGVAPGETTTVEVDGFPVALANADGEYFAFQNLCPHLGATLGGQPLDEDGIITCPRHSSRYDVRTGRCVRPTRDGSSQDLLVFATRLADDMVQVAV